MSRGDATPGQDSAARSDVCTRPRGHFLHHISNKARIFDKAFLGVAGVSMGSCMTLVIV